MRALLRTRNRAPWTDAILGLLCGVLFPAGALAHEIKIHYVCPGNQSLSGHAFLQLIPHLGIQTLRQDLCYGLYYAASPLGGPGIIHNDGWRRPNYTIAYDVDDGTFNLIANFINASIDNPPTYEILTRNCMDFINAAMRAGGIVAPAFTAIADVDAPRTACTSLGMLIAAGFTTLPGTSVAIAAGSGAQVAPWVMPPSVLPWAFDAGEVALQMRTQSNAAGLAASFGHPFMLLGEGIRSTTASHVQLSVSTTPGSAVFASVWGVGGVPYRYGNGPLTEGPVEIGGGATVVVTVLNGDKVYHYTKQLWPESSIGSGDAVGVRSASVDHEVVVIPDPTINRFPSNVGVETVVIRPELVASTTSVEAKGPGRALRVHPNPSRGDLHVRLDGSGHLFGLKVYSIKGALVRHLGATEGNEVMRWDGRDSRGAMAPPGVYWVQAADEHGHRLRATILRLE